MTETGQETVIVPIRPPPKARFVAADRLPALEGRPDGVPVRHEPFVSSASLPAQLLVPGRRHGPVGRGDGRAPADPRRAGEILGGNAGAHDGLRTGERAARTLASGGPLHLCLRGPALS